MPVQTNFIAINPFSLSLAQSKAPGSFCSSIDQSSIITENLCKATLDTQSDGGLRFMTPNRFDCPEYRFFKDEKHLDNYLRNDPRTDIWEIEDNRGYQSTTFYKCENGFGEMQIFLTKEALFREIASGSEHGVFCIQDLKSQEKSYFQKKQGWLQHGFEEVSETEAKKIQEQREASFQTRRKLFAIAVSTLALSPAVLGLGKMLSKSRQNLGELNNSPIFSSVEKAIPLATSAILLSQSFPYRHFAFPMIVGVLSTLSSIKAQFCAQLIGRWGSSSNGLEVAISGNYAFVANYYAGLQIVDITNKTAPVLAGSYGTTGRAYGIAISGNYAYVGEETINSSGLLQIIDVTDKTAPALIGSCDTPDAAVEVAISGNYAYVADASSGLQIIDVTNKSAPALAGSYITPGLAAGIAISDNYAYVVDQTSSLQIIDVTNKTALKLIGSCDIPGIAHSVAISGNYTYIAAHYSGLQIIDVTNKTAPKLIGSYGIPNIATGVAISGNYAYLACSTSCLWIIDVTNKTALEIVGGYGTTGGGCSALKVSISGNYAYVADTVYNLDIFDLFCHTSTTHPPISSSTTASKSSISSSILSSRSSISHSNSPYSPPPILWTGIAIGGAACAAVVCLGACLAGGTTLIYVVKKKRSLSAKRSDGDILLSENNLLSEATTQLSFELDPIVERQRKKIGGAYYQLSKLVKEEAEAIYLQTGHPVPFPSDQEKFYYVIGKGQFGAIKIAQRISDGQYVVSKKVKGEENMKISEAEANLQRDAAGDNILPIYNTINLKNKALYHFMPLAGLGDGSNIQRQLSQISDSKLTFAILTSVAKDLLMGLKTIHDKGIYHLDIKPENIVFTKEGAGFITDFGCAKKSESSDISFSAIGDTRYFSPERWDAIRTKDFFDGRKADLWAAGVTLLQIAKNSNPIQLLALPKAQADRVQRCDQRYFSEILSSIFELQSPERSSFWWVVKALLDPDFQSRSFASELLQEPCFQDLGEKEKLFEELQMEILIRHDSNNSQMQSSHDYGTNIPFVVPSVEEPVYNTADHQQFYDQNEDAVYNN